MMALCGFGWHLEETKTGADKFMLLLTGAAGAAVFNLVGLISFECFFCLAAHL
jgi:hypothetical protein